MEAEIFVGRAGWYRSLLSDVKELVENEKLTLLRIKHQIGHRILKARTELIESGAARGEKGWSGLLGELMTQLSRDLRYSLSELYDSVRLVEKYPKWSDFADREFEVRGTQGGVSDAVRISGKDMSWDEVRREVLYPAPKGPPPVQSQRARIVCVFKSDDCGGDTRKVEICGHHFGDFVVWMNQKKLKIQEGGQR